jgi:hypothetical protein
LLRRPSVADRVCALTTAEDRAERGPAR